MSHELEQKILLLSKHDNPEINKDQIKLVGDKMFLSTNLVIKASGLTGQNGAETIRLGIVRKADATVELSNSVDHLHVVNDAGVDIYEEMAKVLFAQLGGDPVEMKKFLVELSKAETTDGTKPGKAYGGSIVQSDTAGIALMHFHHIKGATFYKIWVSSNPDPTILSAYTRCTPDTFISSRGGEVAVATNVKLHFRIQACNTHGDGVMSDPFGGISFSPTV